MMVFTAAEASLGGQETYPLIHQRTYYMKLKKDPQGGKAPVPYLTPSGPHMDFKVRRTQFASPDLWKLAMKVPTTNKTKNQTTNIFGETIGRLHLDRQDIDKRSGKKA